MAIKKYIQQATPRAYHLAQWIWRKWIFRRWYSACNVVHALNLSLRYSKTKRRLRRERGKRKLRVGFLVYETAKWKCQSVFDLLKSRAEYEPFIIVTSADVDLELAMPDRRRKIEKTCEYFKSNGMNFVVAYDVEKDAPLPLDDIRPDFVFMQSPSNNAAEQCVEAISKFALTFYVPYFVPTWLEDSQYGQKIHRDLFCHFFLNDAQFRWFKSKYNSLWYAGVIRVVGHPALDWYLTEEPQHNKDIIIYAPHWSMDIPGNENEYNWSTFHLTGKWMLEYAKRHPQYRWAFKPHPTLRTAILRSGIMTEKEVCEYYLAWEKLGSSCYTCDYNGLFKSSIALITDCVSFLVEYPLTKNPIIHLKVKNHKKGYSPLECLFDTYYGVYDVEELERALKVVIEQGNDPLRERRLMALNDVGLMGNNAARRIANVLDCV